MEKRHRSSKMSQLLLMEDVEDLGRSGELVAVRPGYARNYLLPKGKGVIADRHALGMQKRLQEERAKQAEVDQAIAEELASQVKGLSVETQVKVDPEGHMYGSVKEGDIVEVLAKEGITIEKRNVQLPQPIKATGEYEVALRFKEDVSCSFHLTIVPSE